MRQLSLSVILTFTMLVAHSCGTANPLPVQMPPQGDAAPTGGSSGSHDAADGAGGGGGAAGGAGGKMTKPDAGSTGACRADSDCRLVDDYCTGCDCRALAKTDPDPTCSGPGVRCLVQPCLRKTASCVAGKCVAR